MKIVLKPVEATLEVMLDLEQRGIINRIAPGHDTLKVAKGESKWVELYAAHESFGPHKLIAVTINAEQPQHFAYHSDREDFMLIDQPGASELVLSLALCHQEELNEKIEKGTLSSSDFMAIRCKPNHPELSFFTMNAGFPHVETCLRASENPPSFYVAESRHLDEKHIDFKQYEVSIETNL